MRFDGDGVCETLNGAFLRRLPALCGCLWICEMLTRVAVA